MNKAELYKDEYLAVRRTLITRTTKTWTSQQLEENNKHEKCMVFAHFMAIDDGKSRELVCRFDTPQEARRFVREHNAELN